MTLFKDFMRRTAGKWLSQSRYLYTRTSRIENLSSDLTISFEGGEGENFRVAMSWKTLSPETGELVSEGEMLTESKGGNVYRSIGYLSEDPVLCEVERVDADCFVLSSSCFNMNFREEIRLVGEDIRLRQTLGMRGVEVFMVGQYYETRVQN